MFFPQTHCEDNVLWLVWHCTLGVLMALRVDAENETLVLRRVA